MHSVLEALGLNNLVSSYIKKTNDEDMKAFRDEVRSLLDGKINKIEGESFSEYGIEELFAPRAAERLRALCVDELNQIAAHSFGKAETILQSINARDVEPGAIPRDPDLLPMRRLKLRRFQFNGHETF